MLTPSAPQSHRRQSKPSRLGTLRMIAANDPTGGEDDLTFTAVFNTSEAAPLAAVNTADAVKWTARYNGSLFEGNTLTLLAPSSIVVEMAFVGYEAGANQVNYAAAASDIADVLGRKLAAFAGIPL